MKRYIKSAVNSIKNEDLQTQLDIAGDTNAPIDILMELANASDPDVWERARFTLRYIHIYSPEKIFSGDSELRNDLALLSFDPDILSILAEDPDYNVRWTVGRSSYTPADVLDKLSSDTNYFVRGGVASNKDAPDYTLARLAHDDDITVRMHVALNRSTPKAVLRKLANDEDDDVRRYALENKNYGG